MKVAVSLIIGIGLGLGIAYGSGPVLGHFGAQGNFAQFHSRTDAADSSFAGNSTLSSPAVILMQTDTALCDQPYFVELYELSISYFSTGSENVNAEEFAENIFDHARNSGYFTAEEAQTWINHINNIPRQFVEIFEEDPTVLDSCIDFQLAAVGPPA